MYAVRVLRGSALGIHSVKIRGEPRDVGIVRDE